MTTKWSAHQRNLLRNRRGCKAHGLQMAHTLPASLPPHWNPARATAFPASPRQAPGQTLLSKWSLFLTIHQENSIQSVQKYPPHSQQIKTRGLIKTQDGPIINKQQ